MSALVDTSVWVAHFKQPNAVLVKLLVSDQVLIHSMILGELACGTPPEPRLRTLNDLNTLQQSHRASWDEVMQFIEREKLYGLGCGWVDLSILASTLLTPAAKLWTLDKRLERLAVRFGISYNSESY
jgi:predicted nucleic acid-binding protein